MNNLRLPSPFGQSRSGPPGREVLGSGGQEGAGVPGFVFLSQPQYNRNNRIQNLHSAGLQQRNNTSFPSNNSPGCTDGNFQFQHPGGRHGNGNQFNQGPGNFNNCGNNNNQNQSLRHNSPFSTPSTRGNSLNNSPYNMNSSQYNRSNNTNNSPYNNNRSFQSPHNNSQNNHSLFANNSPHGDQSFSSPGNNRGVSNNFNKWEGRGGARGSGRGGRGGRGRGGHNTPLSDVPIEKFFNSSMFDDPWEPLTRRLMVSDKQALEDADREYEFDLDESVETIVEAPSDGESSLSSSQSSSLSTSVVEVEGTSSGPTAGSVVTSSQDTGNESLDSFADSWQ